MWIRALLGAPYEGAVISAPFLFPFYKEATANVTEPTQTAADAVTSKNSESPLFIAFIIFDLLAVIALVVLLVVYKRKKK